MNIETLISQAQNAGFQADAVYPYVIISLKNRAVTTMEVAYALGIPQSLCQQSGGDVLILV